MPLTDLERRPGDLVVLLYALGVVPTFLVAGGWFGFAALSRQTRSFELLIAGTACSCLLAAPLAWLCIRGLTSAPSGRPARELLLSLLLTAPAAVGPCVVAWALGDQSAPGSPTFMLLPLPASLAVAVAAFLFVVVLGYRLRSADDPPLSSFLGRTVHLAVHGGGAVGLGILQVLQDQVAWGSVLIVWGLSNATAAGLRWAKAGRAA